jgi:hypothetical protein
LFPPPLDLRVSQHKFLKPEISLFEGQEDGHDAQQQTKPPLDVGWNFDNSYARLPEVFYVRLNPVPVRTPKLVVFNGALAQFLSKGVKP